VINSTGLKNRLIIKELLGEERIKNISLHALPVYSFVPLILPHSFTNKGGFVYYFWYEFGWLKPEQEKIIQVKEKETY
jgi:hypothetical protein